MIKTKCNAYLTDKSVLNMPDYLMEVNTNLLS